MRIAYDILLSLTIDHFYFSDKVFEGFALVPNNRTKALINDLKLITGKKNNCWNMFFRTEGPFATTHDSLLNKEFLFMLKINDPFFYSITDGAYLPGREEILHFNSTLNSVIVPEKRKVCPLKFDYTIHRAMRPVNIKVTNSRGTELLNDTITQETVKTREIDLSDNGENIYNISEDTVPPGSLENEKLFAKENVNGEPFYGTVYFKVLRVDTDPRVNQYEINFETISASNT
jgi:hypothetical protein